jgi:hypothetical protein
MYNSNDDNADLAFLLLQEESELPSWITDMYG